MTLNKEQARLILSVTALLIALRIANAFTIQTFFQPDEYFQSLEPAWRLAFGPEIGAWITWEWRERLRSALHPVIFSGVYRVAIHISALLGLTPSIEAEMLIAAPKLVQAVFAAGTDLYTWKLASCAYGDGSVESFAALFISVVSPWQWFFCTRTFSNALETLLTVVGLVHWPWVWFLQSTDTSIGSQQKSQRSEINLKEILNDASEARDSSKPRSPSATTSPKTEPPPNSLNVSIVAAAVACILRPTNVIIWITIAVASLLRYGSPQKFIALWQAAFLYGTSVLAVTIAIDLAYYGTWTLPPLRFLYFNLVQSLAVFYGRNRHDYYFTEGLPLLLTTVLPFAAEGFWRSLRPGVDRPQLSGYYQRQTRFVLSVVVVTTVLAFSAIAHKEMRFIYPLLPVLHVLAARPLTAFFTPFPLPKSYARLGLLLFGVTINVYIAAYVALVHQRGVIDVMNYLRHEAESDTGVKNITVGFFMPCHSTPWRSHLVHPEIDAWALTCEPPINMSVEERQNYYDEADIFYAHPGSWIEAEMASRTTISKEDVEKLEIAGRRPWPEYLIFFEHLEPVMNAVLHGSRYRECWRGFNTHWIDDGRRRGDVIVRCLN